MTSSPTAGHPRLPVGLVLFSDSLHFFFLTTNEHLTKFRYHNEHSMDGAYRDELAESYFLRSFR